MEGLELVGGVEKREIRLVAHDPAWPLRFATHRRRIAEALGDVAQRIDHVGSTSVEALAAKPILDIQVSVAEPDDESTFVPALQVAGYQLRVRSPGHRMLRTPRLDVHVHLCRAGGGWERRHLLFRDRLRADEDDRRLYEAVKRQLAAREWDDMNQYADAKSQVIAEIMARAEDWAARTGWRVA